MNYLINLGVLFGTFLLSSLSFAWNAQTECSYLQKENESGNRFFMNFTIKASTDSNAFLKTLTVIAADGTNLVYFQEGQNPTKETILLSNISFNSSESSNSTPIDFQVLEEPQNVTPLDLFENLSMIEFSQKVSIVGSNIQLIGITLECSSIETIK